MSAYEMRISDWSSDVCSSDLGAGVQDPSGGVERVAGAAPVTVGGELDSSATPVQGLAGEADDVERVHHRDCVGEFLGGCGLEAGEAVHRDYLDGVAPCLRPVGEPGLEHGLGAAFDHVQDRQSTRLNSSH